MKTILEIFISKLAKTPKNLFRIDSFGAFISGFFLIIIIKYYNQYFNLPLNNAYLLIGIAGLLFLYSGLSSIFIIKHKVVTAIITLMFANISYCFITAFFIIKSSNQLSHLAISYFTIEIIIILCLIFIEFIIIKKLTNELRTAK